MKILFNSTRNTYPYSESNRKNRYIRDNQTLVNFHWAEIHLKFTGYCACNPVSRIGKSTRQFSCAFHFSVAKQKKRTPANNRLSLSVAFLPHVHTLSHTSNDIHTESSYDWLRFSQLYSPPSAKSFYFLYKNIFDLVVDVLIYIFSSILTLGARINDTHIHSMQSCCKITTFFYVTLFI